ncbi:MAG: response regulator, partial [Methylococcaceae bacterium]
LFQPFNRLGQENGSEEGTGIGLMVTKQLVEMMGGTIGMESNVGKGSEFWIELIRNANPQPANCTSLSFQKDSQAPGNPTHKTVLYVEDNPANLMLVEQLIEEHTQLRFLSAADGSLGVALARAHYPDVILMDINLPGINGFQALKMLREDPSTAHIPVVAISANAMPRDIAKGLGAGFFRYITKPIKVNELLGALDDALKFSKTGSAYVNGLDKHND